MLTHAARAEWLFSHSVAARGAREGPWSGQNQKCKSKHSINKSNCNHTRHKLMLYEKTKLGQLKLWSQHEHGSPLLTLTRALRARRARPPEVPEKPSLQFSCFAAARAACVSTWLGTNTFAKPVYLCARTAFEGSY